MTEKEKGRILNIEGAIIGVWTNKERSLMFEGTLEAGEVGVVESGPPGLPITDLNYQIFIKDEKPFLRLIDQQKEEDNQTEYEIAYIKTNDKLILRTRFNQEIVFHSGTQAH